MKVKRFRAEDRATALKQIRSELGADAVIVAESRVRTGGLFGMFGRVEVEILAALEERPAAPRTAATPVRATPVRPGEVEAAISPEARRAALSSNRGDQRTNTGEAFSGRGRATLDGAGRLAAILEQLPRSGATVSPEMTSRLADLLAQGSGGGSSSSGAVGSVPVGGSMGGASVSGIDASNGSLAGGMVGSVAMTDRMPPTSPVPDITTDTATRNGLPNVVNDGPASGMVGSASGLFAPAEPAGTGVVAASPVPEEARLMAPRVFPDSATAAPVRDGGLQTPEPASGNLPSDSLPRRQAETTAPPPDRSAQQSVERDGGMQDMQHTLSDLRASVERLMRQQQTQLWPRDLPVVRTVYQHLIAQELDPTISLEVVGEVSDEVNEGRVTDSDALLLRVRELIANRIQVREVSEVAQGPTVIVLVGPTGVGKTTTLAKLAAHLALNENRRVALVTTDTFRIAAASQLGTYAELMDLPLEVAYTPDELRAAVKRQSDADYILVDSPGCAQRNETQIQELREFVGTLTGATVLLTVSATVKLRDLIDIQAGFGVLPITGLVLTKLDETTVFGPVMSLVAMSSAKDRPVFFITSGQNVPKDLEVATRGRLADLLVGQLLAQAIPNVPSKSPRELVRIGDVR